MNLVLSRVRQGLWHSLSLMAGSAFLLVAACGAPARTAPAAVDPVATEQRAVPEREIREDTVVVVFLGDSLTAGYGLDPADALPQQVEAIWRAQGIDAVAVNAGVSGDTSANGLARFDWSVASASPDLLVVALGANDFLLGVPPEVTRANLAGILERAAVSGIPAVLVGLEPRGEVETDSREAAFAGIYPALADEFDLPYYPSLLGAIEKDPSMLQSDGLHPTREGTERVAGPLAEFLEPVIASVQGP